MITTADYLIKASVGKVEYFFEHYEKGVWDALEKFWHDDYPEVLEGKDGSALFPMEVYAMHDGLVITFYRFTFNAAVFRAFFDKGHTAEGRYTLDQFAIDIERKNTANDVTSFFYYMWNRWSKEECEHVFRDGDHRHFWNKWCEVYDTMNGPRGATELFYMALSDTNRDKLVARALECYDGMTEKQ